MEDASPSIKVQH